MVGRLAELKARLTWNGLRADVQRRVGLPLTVALLGWAGMQVAAGLRAGIGEVGPQLAGDYTAWTALLALAAWVTLPIVLFPLDENLDPARFALAPMSRIQLATGLTVAGLVSPSVIVPVLVLGTGIASWWNGAGVFVLVTAILLLLTMTVGSQLFTTILSAVLKTRRGRDLSVVIVAVIGLAAFGSQQTVKNAIERLGLAGAVANAPLLTDWWWLPAVSSVKVSAEASDGRLFAAVIATVVSIGWIVGLAWLWQWILGWMLTTPEGTPGPRRVRATRGMAGHRKQRDRPRHIVPTWRSRLSSWHPVIVLARKELRFYLRDPRQRLVWTGAAIFIGIAAASILVGTANLDRFQQEHWLPLLAPILVLFVGLPIALNQFGWERNAASFLFVFPTSPRQLLLGKNAAAAIALGIETGAMTLLLVVLSGSTTDLVLVPALGFCAIACQLAVGNLVSVVAPLRLPREGTDLFSQATEQGCLAIGAQLVSFGLIGLLLVLPASLTVLTVSFDRPVANWVTITFTLVWGALAYAVSIWASGAILRRRLPEVAGMVQVR